MRLGQVACTMVTLPSDEEIRLALVPLSGAERLNATQAAANITVLDNVAGLMSRDHVQKVEVLAASIRDPKDLTKKLFRDGYDLQEELIETDIDFVYDYYLEMTENANPTVDAIPPEEFDVLKKVLQEIDLSGLSGRSWYALKRFLGAMIQDGLLTGNSLGSISNTKLITMNESEKFTPTVSASSTEQSVKSATSQLGT